MVRDVVIDGQPDEPAVQQVVANLLGHLDRASLSLLRFTTAIVIKIRARGSKHLLGINSTAC